ncbi:hypothetical protein VTN96DRAFT_4922 [Rasamsonia emersonii]
MLIILPWLRWESGSQRSSFLHDVAGERPNAPARYDTPCVSPCFETLFITGDKFRRIPSALVGGLAQTSRLGQANQRPARPSKPTAGGRAVRYGTVRRAAHYSRPLAPSPGPLSYLRDKLPGPPRFSIHLRASTLATQCLEYYTIHRATAEELVALSSLPGP